MVKYTKICTNKSMPKFIKSSKTDKYIVSAFISRTRKNMQLHISGFPDNNNKQKKSEQF